MKRPLFWIGVVFLSATVAFCYLPLPAALLCGLCAAILAVGLAGGSRIRTLALFLGCVAVSATLCDGWAKRYCADLAPVCDREVEATMTVSARSQYGALYFCDGYTTLTADGVSRNATATVSSFFPLDAAPGDELRFKAKALPLPQSFAELSKQRTVRLYHQEMLPHGDFPAHPFYGALVRFRLTLAHAAARLAPGEEGGVLAALLAGESSLLRESSADALRGAGLSHLVVVSGLHLSTLAMLLATLLGKIPRLGARMQSLLLIGFCWAFAGVTGLGPSVTRAALMLTLTQIGGLIGRRGDGPTSLAFAGIVLGLWDPAGIGSLSFLLSFLATAGILLLSQPLEAGMIRCLPEALRKSDALRGLLDAISVTASAQIGAMPVLIAAFGIFNPWAIAANLPAAPLVGALLPLGWLGLIVQAVLPPLAVPVGAVCRALCQALLTVARAFSALPFAQIGIHEHYQLLWILGFCLMSVLLCVWRPPPRIVLRSMLAVTLSFLLAANLDATLGRASAELLCFTDGPTALVRGHRAVLFGVPRSPAQTNRVIDALCRRGVQTLDCILLQNPDTIGTTTRRVADRFGCRVLVTRVTPSSRAFCRTSGMTLSPLPTEPFAPLGVSVTLDGERLLFSLSDATMFNPSENYDILESLKRPLPALGKGCVRYRFQIGGKV